MFFTSSLRYDYTIHHFSRNCNRQFEQTYVNFFGFLRGFSQIHGKIWVSLLCLGDLFAGVVTFQVRDGGNGKIFLNVCGAIDINRKMGYDHLYSI